MVSWSVQPGEGVPGAAAESDRGDAAAFGGPASSASS